MESVAFIDALTEYKDTFLPARNLADRTRREYITDVSDLVTFLVARGVTEPGHLTLSHLNAYLAELDTRGLSGYTRRRKTSSIKTFCNFLVINNYVLKDPSLKLIPPKRESTTPRVLSEIEYKALQLAAANQPLAAAILEVLLQTGIRLSELTNLTLQDVQLPQKISKDAGNVGSLFIRKGKGRKDRVITLNYKACRAIKAYLAVRPSVETTKLFISKFGKGITPRGVEWLVHKYLEEAGIQGAKTHSLRHTFGTMMVKKKTSLPVVQEMMGHESLDTTRHYVQLAREMMDDEVQRNAL
jgi:integrase/recombinase XerD